MSGVYLFQMSNTLSHLQCDESLDSVLDVLEVGEEEQRRLEDTYTYCDSQGWLNTIKGCLLYTSRCV